MRITRLLPALVATPVLLGACSGGALPLEPEAHEMHPTSLTAATVPLTSTGRTHARPTPAFDSSDVVRAAPAPSAGRHSGVYAISW